jgi:hypothetical protein
MRRIACGAVAAVVGLGGSATAQTGRPAAKIGGIQAVIPAGGVAPSDVSYKQQPGPMPPAGTVNQPPVFGTPMPIPDSQSGTTNPAAPTLPGPYAGPYGTTAPNGTYVGPLPGQPGTYVVTPGVPDICVPGIPGQPVDPAIAHTQCGPKLWVYGEGLLWWTKGANFPPLLTTSSPQFNGIIGQGDTSILLGGTQSTPYMPGFRVGLGYWLGDCHVWALDTSFFYLPKHTMSVGTDSNSFPVLARPFVDANTGTPLAEIIASPGLSAGAFNARYETTLWGGDVNLRRYLCGNPCNRLDLIGGFRYLSLDERLDIVESFARVPGSNTGIGASDVASGQVFDSFHTQNRFYGGQLGLDWEVRRGRWFVDMTGKVAIGAMHSTVSIDGGQNLNLVNGGTRTATGGLLALPGNIGTTTETKFAWVPELGVTLGYHITPRLRATVGYNLLYASHVLRPGDQIDTTLDVTKIPNFPIPNATPVTPPHPVPTMQGTSFWAQGINLGLQYTW